MKNNFDESTPIFFIENGYTELSKLIEQNNYSKLFFITDTNSNDNCLPILLQNLATEVPIEIIEFENGEENKNIKT